MQTGGNRKVVADKILFQEKNHPKVAKKISK
jgi:hypothetical protein